MEFFQSCEELSWNLFQALAISLKLLPTDLTDLISDKNCHGALLHYPPINNSPEANKFRFKPHTGAGTFGLIFQKDQSRYSLAFKISPNDDAEIRCFEKCVSENNPRKYPPISVKDYYQEWEAKHLHIYSNQN